MRGLEKLARELTDEEKEMLRLHEAIHAILNPPENRLYDPKFREMTTEEIVEFLEKEKKV